MWTREELKTKAKAAFKGNYWNCVGATFVITALIALAGGFVTYFSNVKDAQSSMDAKSFIAIAIVAVLEVLVINPIAAGLNYYFLKNSKGEKATIGDAFYFYKEGRFSNAVGVLFLKNLFLSLWTLLLIVPGVIKYYEYKMIDYVLAENPEMSWKEIFAKSKEMMNGQKMNTFVLELSFFGWALLAVVTFGILEIFYVEPYMYATEAELYLALKK